MLLCRHKNEGNFRVDNASKGQCKYKPVCLRFARNVWTRVIVGQIQIAKAKKKVPV